MLTNSYWHQYFKMLFQYSFKIEWAHTKLNEVMPTFLTTQFNTKCKWTRFSTLGRPEILTPLIALDMIWNPHPTRSQNSIPTLFLICQQIIFWKDSPSKCCQAHHNFQKSSILIYIHLPKYFISGHSPLIFFLHTYNVSYPMKTASKINVLHILIFSNGR